MCSKELKARIGNNYTNNLNTGSHLSLGRKLWGFLGMFFSVSFSPDYFLEKKISAFIILELLCSDFNLVGVTFGA